MHTRQMARRALAGLLVVALWLPLAAQGERGRAERSRGRRMLEIRSYNLKPGTRDRFHQRFIREALPLLKQAKVDVVAYGPSLHDRDSYYLMRGYASLDDRQQSEDAFYGSDAWKHGPREAVLADIESYTTVVIALDESTVGGLRR